MHPQSVRVGRVGDEAGVAYVVVVTIGRGLGNSVGVCGEREISVGRGAVACFLSLKGGAGIF